jgi:hypothetical protein
MDQHAHLVAFADDATSPPMQAAIRFINAMPGGSAVVFGTGTVSNGSFSPLTGAVAVGSASSMVANGTVEVDENGYVFLAPVAGVALSAHDADSQNGILGGPPSVPGGLAPFDAGFGGGLSPFDAGFSGGVGAGVGVPSAGMVGTGAGTGVFGTYGDDLAVASNVTWQAGNVGTVVLVDGMVGFKPEIMVCTDSAQGQTMSPCSVLSQ